MYHIKEDKRCITSVNLIIKGLNECLKEKSFKDITITDIQRKSTVGRATFYRLFDNTTDILYYQWNQLFKNMIEEGKKNKNINTENATILLFNYLTKNSSLLEIIINDGSINILYQAFRNYADDIHEILIPNISLSEKEIDYFISIASCAIVGTLVAWIKHEKKESSNELSNIYKTTLKALSV